LKPLVRFLSFAVAGVDPEIMGIGPVYAVPKALTTPTGEGFLYRTDMRLRPWGRSGSLVVSVDGYLDYVKNHALLWEKQALLKARPIAGDMPLAARFLEEVQPHLFCAPVEEVRKTIRDMKSRIEQELQQKGRSWGEVKSGEGSIRDVEFVTQFLQMAHGGRHPEVRSFNTLRALVRLADFGFLQADEYRQLSTGYVFLRTIEHALQLMHNKQTHSLPEDERELAYLARRLDFPDTARFLAHYEQSCSSIRQIYEKYIEGAEQPVAVAPRVEPEAAPVIEGMEPSYAEIFSPDEIRGHKRLLDRLGEENIVEVEAVPRDDGTWRLTVVGFDQIGDLSMICGLLFVYGFDIVDGNVFTAEQVEAPTEPAAPGRFPGRR
ncbi:MAG TPA: hypothetical protein EYP14_18385, partial [Planctomycetaceae bacterium]|nr:hypothetical protein [Planctomycetaceae bacterium]